MKNKTETKEKKGSAAIQTFAVLIGTVIFIFVLSFLSSLFFPDGRGMRMIGFFEQFILFKAILSTVNSVLLIYLIYNYVSFYNEIKSQFSLGLIVMSLALFAFSISDNPLFPFLFGLRGAGMGAFTIIPSIFTLIAVIVLIYLSRK